MNLSTLDHNLLHIFVIYLMTFHGLSNAVATLYLSFVLHVLSRFCTFVEPQAGTSALVAPAASLPLSPPPVLTPQPQQQPSSSTHIGLESLLQPSSGLINSMLDSDKHTQPREASLSSSLPSQPAPLPPPPLSMLVTLASVRQRLGMQSDFDQYLVCPDCGKLTLWSRFDSSWVWQILCACGAKLLYNHNRHLILLYCHCTLESIFSGVLKDDKYYNTLKDWLEVVGEASNTASHSFMPASANLCQDDTLQRPATSCAKPTQDSRFYSKVATGSAWLEDCGDSAEDCQRQCHGDHAPFIATGLNLKLTLSVDWFGPQKGKFHEWHPTGAILLRIDNLPARLTTHNWRCLGIHLVGLLPGPKESLAARLQSFLRLIVDELVEFDLNGKTIPTYAHPEGKLMKARLHLVVADTPAWAKVAGFALKYKKGTICAYCPKQSEKLGLMDDEEEEDSFVGSQRHVIQQQTAAGFSRVAVDKLCYFSTVDSCPPNIMHAIHLGLCKRFWHRFLIEHCNEIGLQLPEAQSVIASALLPSNVHGPNKLIGSKSGGNPTAEQWEVLFRVLLPFILMQLWSTSLCGDDDEVLVFLLTRHGAPSLAPSIRPMSQIASAAAGTSCSTLDLSCDQPSAPPFAASSAPVNVEFESNKDEHQPGLGVGIDLNLDVNIDAAQVHNKGGAGDR